MSVRVICTCVSDGVKEDGKGLDLGDKGPGEVEVKDGEAVRLYGGGVGESGESI